MDKKIEFYKNCVKNLLLPYESRRTENIKNQVLFDDERLHYMAVAVGWINHKQYHISLMHIDICDGKINIHCNNTERLIISELVEMGVPRQDICSAFLPPSVRALADIPESPPKLIVSANMGLSQHKVGEPESDDQNHPKVRQV